MKYHNDYETELFLTIIYMMLLLAYAVKVING